MSGSDAGGRVRDRRVDVLVELRAVAAERLTSTFERTSSCSVTSTVLERGVVRRVGLERHRLVDQTVSSADVAVVSSRPRTGPRRCRPSARSPSSARRPGSDRASASAWPLHRYRRSARRCRRPRRSARVESVCGGACTAATTRSGRSRAIGPAATERAPPWCCPHVHAGLTVAPRATGPSSISATPPGAATFLNTRIVGPFTET